MNLLNKYYGKKLQLFDVTEDLFKYCSVVRVVCLVLDSRESKIVKDIRYISIDEGAKRTSLLNGIVKDDGNFYLYLVNHPSGNLSLSEENLSLYRSLKRITDRFDLVQVSRGEKAYVSYDSVFSVL